MNADIRNILIPGGLGFIGSHTIIHIIEQTNASVVIINRQQTSYEDVLSRMKTILSSKFPTSEIERRVRFYKGSILDIDFL
jgi:UDP-glucose 4-epimerase